MTEFFKTLASGLLEFVKFLFLLLFFGFFVLGCSTLGAIFLASESWLGKFVGVFLVLIGFSIFCCLLNKQDQ